MQGFRSDQQGALRSRLGSALVNTAGSNPIRSLTKALGLRYQGSDALYRAFSSIETGFSGEPMGMVDAAKRLWVMDQSKRRKDDGSADAQWHIDAPADPPTVAPASEVTKEIDDFDSGSYTVDPSGDDSFDSSEKKEGSNSLLISAADDTTYTIVKSVTLDLSEITTGVDASDDDLHRIYIYASKFKKIDEITLEVGVDSSAGTFNDYYTATLSRKFLKKVRKGWQRIEIRRRQLRDANDNIVEDKKGLPYFKRIGATSGRDWATVTAIRIKLDTRGAVDVRFDLWDVVGSVDGPIEGEDIQYGFTYINDYGDESTLSDLSPKQVFNRTGGSLSDLDASADAQVTKKHIYRTGGTLGGRIMRVTETAVANATTTYTDKMSDASALALGIEAPLDNDAPPAAQGLIGPYFGRLIAFNSSSNKNRFWWSKLNKFYAFPGAALDAGNWADIGDSGEKIWAATQRPRFILFYKENTIWRLVGDPDDIDGQVEITNATVGTVGPQAVCSAGAVDYFVGKEGVYAFNGDSERKISEKIDPIFKGQTVTLASGVTTSPMSSSNRDKTVLEYVNGRLYMSYCTSGSTPNATLVLNIETGNWYSIDIGYSALYYEGQNGDFLGGKSSGAVHQLETGTTEPSSAAINVDYFSRYFDAGANDTKKTFEDVTIDCNPNGETLTVTGYYNDGTSVALGTMTGSSRARFVFQTDSGDGIQAYNFAVRITGAISAEVVIYDIALNYYFEARQAKSFDTDETDFGTGKMKQIRETMLDMDNAAQITLNLLTDQPGAAMTSRQAPTVALSTTRRMAHIVFNSDYRGKLIRQYISGTDFHIYGIRSLIKVYGTYLIGADGEYWFSNSIDFGTERVKLIKEIEVVYTMASGTCNLVIESDLPGGTFATRETLALSTTTGEQTKKLRCQGTLKGRLFTFKLAPSADLIVEAVRAYVKMIGEPFATQWQWISLPVEASEDAVWRDVSLPVDEVA